MFETFGNRYDLRGWVLTETGLHVGAGGSLAVVGSDNPVVRDAQGRPFIPGSSFKGALRSTIEALVNALSPGGKREPWACNPLDDGQRCVKPDDVQNKSDDEITQLVEHSVNNGGRACTVCRLFGSPWLASKVKVKDLYLDVPPGQEWLGRVEVRDGVAIDRDTETVAGGRKYDFEVVPRETPFCLHLRVDNASQEELGLLFLGLREFNNGGAVLGGNTSRGLGAVRIEWREFELVEKSGLLDYLRSGRGRILKPGLKATMDRPIEQGEASPKDQAVAPADLRTDALAKAVQAVRLAVEEGRLTDASGVGQILSERLGVNKDYLKKYGIASGVKDLLQQAVAAGLLVEEKGSYRLGEPAPVPDQTGIPPAEEPEPAGLEEPPEPFPPGDTIEAFMDECIQKFIEWVRKGGQ